MELHLTVTGVACHIGSQSAACHPTQVNVPHLTYSQTASTRFTYLRVDCKNNASDWLHTEMVYPNTDVYPSKYQPGSTQPEVETCNAWITSPMP